MTITLEQTMTTGKIGLKIELNIFTIEVLTAALMDNHMHNLIRTRPDILESCSDKEIAKRWTALSKEKS